MMTLYSETRPEICECAAADAVSTYEVTLCSGDVIEVTGVDSVELSSSQITLNHRDTGPTVFVRRDVYFVSCGHCSLPPAE
jgi:hypothetical protein